MNDNDIQEATETPLPGEGKRVDVKHPMKLIWENGLIEYGMYSEREIRHMMTRDPATSYNPELGTPIVIQMNFV